MSPPVCCLPHGKEHVFERCTARSRPADHGSSLRVVDVRGQGDEEPMVLVVEDSPAIKRSKRGMRRRTIVYVAVAIVVVILVLSEITTGCDPVPG